MATDNVRSCTSDPKKIVPWLDHHGSQLTSLHLESRCNLSLGPSHSPSQGPSRCSAPLLCALLDPLPCSNLLQLSLRGLPVALGASDGRHPVLLEAATRLTSLELHMRSREDLKVFTFHEWRYVGESRALEDLQACYHFNKADDTNGECDSERLMSLRVLRYLLALQRLDLSVGDDSASLTYQLIGKDYRLTSEIMGCWSTHLTSLSINGVLALDSFQSLSPFTKLQRLYLNLRLGVCKDNWQEADPVLPEPLCQQLQELTHLSLYMEKHNFMEPTKIMGPTLSGCSGLQELYLYAPSVDVSAFEGLTGLRTLHLVADAVFQGAASGVAAVFEHIGRMHHLERLVIAGGFLGATVALGAGDAELCMGLTASVHLKHLDLSGLKLPRSAWMHLFPRGQQLPQLPDFKLCFEERRVFLDGCALEHMAACCHAIDRLSFERMSLFKWDVSLAPLRLLGQLVDLECDGAVDGDASVGALACITSLTRLHMRASGQLSDCGLLQLTALKGLQEFTVEAGKWQRGDNLSIIIRPGPGRDIIFKVGTLQAAKMQHAVYLWQFAAHGSFNRQKTGQPAHSMPVKLAYALLFSGSCLIHTLQYVQSQTATMPMLGFPV